MYSFFKKHMHYYVISRTGIHNACSKINEPISIVKLSVYLRYCMMGIVKAKCCIFVDQGIRPVFDSLLTAINIMIDIL